MNTPTIARALSALILAALTLAPGSAEAVQPPAKCKLISVVYETGIDLPIDAESRAVSVTRKCRGRIVVTVVRYDLETGQRL